MHQVLACQRLRCGGALMMAMDHLGVQGSLAQQQLLQPWLLRRKGWHQGMARGLLPAMAPAYRPHAPLLQLLRR
jgi:hypothetical protein